MSKKLLKRCGKLFLILFAIFFTLELLIRIALSIRIGPDVLLYGTRFCKRQVTPFERWDYNRTKRTVETHENIVKKYSKYYPNQKRMDVNKKGEFFSVTINSKGFRGKDYDLEKPDNILRIACLGGSSTFGYTDKDDETYPNYLEKILKEELHGLKSKKFNSVEVINLGIPHLDSEQIYSLFINEAISMKPDIVTFYEGVNDTVKPLSNKNRNVVLADYLEWMSSNFLIFRKSLGFNFMRYFIQRDVKYSKAYFIEYIKGRSAIFIKNLDLIKKECDGRGIKFYVITQQSKSFFVADMKGVSYEREAELLRDKINKEPVRPKELCFLASSVLMSDLRKWAEDNNVIVVDGIKALDDRRDCLTSWVHLTPEGNNILAAAIAKSILATYDLTGKTD